MAGAAVARWGGAVIGGGFSIGVSVVTVYVAIAPASGYGCALDPNSRTLRLKVIGLECGQFGREPLRSAEASVCHQKYVGGGGDGGESMTVAVEAPI